MKKERGGKMSDIKNINNKFMGLTKKWKIIIVICTCGLAFSLWVFNKIYGKMKSNGLSRSVNFIIAGVGAYFSLGIVFLLMFPIIMLTNTTPEVVIPEAKTSKIEKTKDKTAEVETQKYKTAGEWSLYDSIYVFSVEGDMKKGDSYESGDYIFKSSISDVSKENVPGVYDVYVSTNSNLTKNQLVQNEMKCTIGGLKSEICEITLSKGEFVYIVPNPVTYDPKGYLLIRKK